MPIFGCWWIRKKWGGLLECSWCLDFLGRESLSQFICRENREEPSVEIVGSVKKSRIREFIIFHYPYRKTNENKIEM